MANASDSYREEGTAEKRRRGRRPADAAERRRLVLAALADLEAARVPFSMADVAERAGISRATLYRDAGLRDVVGAKGDGPAARPVDFKDFRRLESEKEELRAERRRLRQEVRDLKKQVAEAHERIDALLEENSGTARKVRAEASEDVERLRRDAYAEGFQAGVRTTMGQRGGGTHPGGARYPGAGSGASLGAAATLTSVAARLPKPALVTARKKLARLLHPDRFEQEDPATALLATELLKQINALVSTPSGGGGQGT